MLLHVLSDLHNEHSEHSIATSIKHADVIVLAGDIDVGVRGLKWAANLLKIFPGDIIYVAGNHEYYQLDIDQTRQSMRDFCMDKQRLHFLDNDAVHINGVRFLGCTLWTDFQLFGLEQKQACMFDGARGLNDFRLIGKEGGRFTTEDSIDLHQESVEWLEQQLNVPFDGGTVVVTHHCPSWQSVAERYREDSLSACFSSRLDHLMGRSGLWIHGHTHDSFDYELNGTRVICNPRGYTSSWRPSENQNFNPELVVEIPSS